MSPNMTWNLGYWCTNTPRPEGFYNLTVKSCATSACGDGLMDLGEECDDGYTNDTNGCSNSCLKMIGY